MRSRDLNQTAAIVKLRQEHPEMPSKEMAVIIGVSKSTINYHLRMAGYTRWSIDYAVRNAKPKKYNKLRKPADSQVKDRAGWCKCLGHCGQTFFSPDKINIRICPFCTQRNRGGTDETYTVHLYG